MANQYTKSEINIKYVNQYILENKTLKEICDSSGISRKILTRWIVQSGYKIRPKKKLDYDETLFDNIDTEEKAYWLGFIYADGYVSDKSNFEISLSLKDTSHLIKLGKLLNYTVKKDHFRCRLSISNLHLTDSLKRHGVIPRKSLIATFPEHLDNCLIRHFIRGYFDGDGCISVSTKPPSYQITVSILGTLNVLCNIEKKSNVSFYKAHDKRHHTDCYSMRIYSHEDKYDFLKYIYENSTIYLNRKYNLYLKVKEQYEKYYKKNNME